MTAEEYLEVLQKIIEKSARCDLSESQEEILRDAYGELAKQAERNPRIWDKSTRIGKRLRQQAQIVGEQAANLCAQEGRAELSDMDLWGGISAARGGCPLC